MTMILKNFEKKENNTDVPCTGALPADAKFTLEEPK